MVFGSIANSIRRIRLNGASRERQCARISAANSRDGYDDSSETRADRLGVTARELARWENEGGRI